MLFMDVAMFPDLGFDIGKFYTTSKHVCVLN